MYIRFKGFVYQPIIYCLLKMANISLEISSPSKPFFSSVGGWCQESFLKSVKLSTPEAIETWINRRQADSTYTWIIPGILPSLKLTVRT